MGRALLVEHTGMSGVCLKVNIPKVIHQGQHTAMWPYATITVATHYYYDHHHQTDHNSNKAFIDIKLCPVLKDTIGPIMAKLDIIHKQNRT